MKKLIFGAVLGIMFNVHADIVNVGLCATKDGRCPEGIRDSGRASDISANTFASFLEPIIRVGDFLTRGSIRR